MKYNEFTNETHTDIINTIKKLNEISSQTKDLYRSIMITLQDQQNIEKVFCNNCYECEKHSLKCKAVEGKHYEHLLEEEKIFRFYDNLQSDFIKHDYDDNSIKETNERNIYIFNYHLNYMNNLFNELKQLENIKLCDLTK